MSKVALITIFSINNYGSALQAYASQRMFELAGVQCDIINYRYPNEWHYAQGFNRNSMLKQLSIYVATPLLKAFNIPSHHVSMQKLKVFRKRNFRFTRHFDSLRQLEQADWSDYDAVICGSDQIWNPRFLHGDKAFLLSFVPDDVRKISFSSSFATDRIPEEYEPLYRKLLSRFSAITVRESAGVDIVRNQLALDVEADTMPDPTLMLNASQWLELAQPYMGVIPSEPYIVLYPLNYAFDPRPYIYDVAREIQRRTNALIIALGSDPDWPSDLKVENRRNVSAEEFVALMSGAECVVTSSFHGTAFAVNFGRPLVSVVPAGASGDDRQRSLLSSLGISDKAVEIGTPVGSLNPCYDSGIVRATLDSIREKKSKLILSYISAKK